MILRLKVPTPDVPLASPAALQPTVRVCTHFLAAHSAQLVNIRNDRHGRRILGRRSAMFPDTGRGFGGPLVALPLDMPYGEQPGSCQHAAASRKPPTNRALWGARSRIMRSDTNEAQVRLTM